MKKEINLLVSLIFVGVSVTSFAQTKFTLGEIQAKIQESSPLLLENRAKRDQVIAANKLVNSYYFPQLSLKHAIYKTNNPVEVFASKLMQEKFAMSDMMPDKMNNPERYTNNLTTAELVIPVDITGLISTSKDEVKSQGESLNYESTFIEKEIMRSVYKLVVANHSLDQLEKFVVDEQKYLKRIIDLYDNKNSDNKNRYLSYNQAKIIMISLGEMNLVVTSEKKKIQEALNFLIGIKDVQISYIPESDPVAKESDQISVSKEGLAQTRDDLKAMQSYISSLDSKVTFQKKKMLPTMGVFARYNISTEDFNGHGSDQAFGVMLKWDFGLSSYENVAYESAAKTVQAKAYEEKMAKTENEMKTLQEDLVSLKNRESEISKKHELFSENKRILTQQYQRGSVELYNMLDNFTHYIENYAQLLNVRQELYSKKYQFVGHLKEVKF